MFNFFFTFKIANNLKNRIFRVWISQKIEVQSEKNHEYMLSVILWGSKSVRENINILQNLTIMFYKIEFFIQFKQIINHIHGKNRFFLGFRSYRNYTILKNMDEFFRIEYIIIYMHEYLFLSFTISLLQKLKKMSTLGKLWKFSIICVTSKYIISIENMICTLLQFGERSLL